MCFNSVSRDFFAWRATHSVIGRLCKVRSSEMHAHFADLLSDIPELYLSTLLDITEQVYVDNLAVLMPSAASILNALMLRLVLPLVVDMHKGAFYHIQRLNLDLQRLTDVMRLLERHAFREHNVNLADKPNHHGTANDSSVQQRR